MCFFFFKYSHPCRKVFLTQLSLSRVTCCWWNIHPLLLRLIYMQENSISPKPELFYLIKFFFLRLLLTSFWWCLHLPQAPGSRRGYTTSRTCFLHFPKMPRGNFQRTDADFSQWNKAGKCVKLRALCSEHNMFCYSHIKKKKSNEGCKVLDVLT